MLNWPEQVGPCMLIGGERAHSGGQKNITCTTGVGVAPSVVVLDGNACRSCPEELAWFGPQS